MANRSASTRKASRKQRKTSRKERKTSRKERRQSRRQMKGGNHPSCDDDCSKGGEHDITGVKSHAPAQALYKCKKCGKVCVNN